MSARDNKRVRYSGGGTHSGGGKVVRPSVAVTPEETITYDVTNFSSTGLNALYNEGNVPFEAPAGGWQLDKNLFPVGNVVVVGLSTSGVKNGQRQYSLKFKDADGNVLATAAMLGVWTTSQAFDPYPIGGAPINHFFRTLNASLVFTQTTPWAADLVLIEGEYIASGTGNVTGGNQASLYGVRAHPVYMDCYP